MGRQRDCRRQLPLLSSIRGGGGGKGRQIAAGGEGRRGLQEAGGRREEILKDRDWHRGDDGRGGLSTWLSPEVGMGTEAPHTGWMILRIRAGRMQSKG